VGGGDTGGDTGGDISVESSAIEALIKHKPVAQQVPDLHAAAICTRVSVPSRLARIKPGMSWKGIARSDH
jgi:hypothetical protein